MDYFDPEHPLWTTTCREEVIMNTFTKACSPLESIDFNNVCYKQSGKEEELEVFSIATHQNWLATIPISYFKMRCSIGIYKQFFIVESRKCIEHAPWFMRQIVVNVVF